MENGLVPTTPRVFLDIISDIWGSFFLKQCEKLAITKPYLTDEELEAEAEDITNSYFYFRERDMLPYYNSNLSWRDGMQ